MKKSNLLLLGTFATFLLLLLGLHLMVAARFKSGQYKTLSEDAWMADFTWMTLAPAKVIEVKDVKNIEVYSAADSRASMPKNGKTDFKTERVGDTVRIRHDGQEPSGRLHLFLDSSTQLRISNSSISFKGSKYKGPSVVNVTLDESFFGLGGFNDDDSTRIDGLNIRAFNNSTINFNKASAGTVNVSINNSRLVSDKANVQQMALQADDASGIEISSKQLRLIQAKQ